MPSAEAGPVAGEGHAGIAGRDLDEAGIDPGAERVERTPLTPSSESANAIDEAATRGPAPPAERPRRWSLLPPPVLFVILAAFVGLRLPPVLCQAGGTDEEWYAIPGLTVAREGVPRIPYARATEAGSVFLGADRLLFGLVPLTFYAEAPFFLVLPPTYATARLASLAAGCIAIVLVHAIARTLWDDHASGFWAAGIYAACRLMYFPATFARPDMLCGALGLAAAWALCRWGRDRRGRWLASAGVLLGLAGLTHPFALMVALQLGIWAALAPGPARARLTRTVGLAAAALATFSVWLILILQAPELFWSQFFANNLGPTGPGMASRFLHPWPEFAHHMPLVVERAGALQAGFLAACMAVLARLAWRRRDRDLALPSVLGLSSVYLLISLQGRHPLEGYWCYPVAFFALAAGWCVARCVTSCGRRLGAKAASGLAVGLLALVFLPGSGLRTTRECVWNWHKLEYNPREFTRAILDDLPPDARLTVGAEFALEAYGLGRRVLLGIRGPIYFDATRYEYDYAILGRSGLREGLDRALGGRVLRTYGDESDPFACYAVLLAPAGRAVVSDAVTAP